MEWFIYALFGAFFSATSAMIVKKGLKKTEPIVLLTWISFVAGIFMMVASINDILRTLKCAVSKWGGTQINFVP